MHGDKIHVPVMAEQKVLGPWAALRSRHISPELPDSSLFVIWEKWHSWLFVISKLNFLISVTKECNPYGCSICTLLMIWGSISFLKLNENLVRGEIWGNYGFLSWLSNGIKLFLVLGEIETQEKRNCFRKDKVLFHTFDFIASKIHACDKSTKWRNDFSMTPENGTVWVHRLSQLERDSCWRHLPP